MQATPIEGTIVINAGDLLARWSNDIIRSTDHRVVSPPLKNPTDEFYPARYIPNNLSYSIAYFCNPNQDALIESFDKSSKAKYEPVNAYQYLTARLTATY